jgi:hypothetical protein
MTYGITPFRPPLSAPVRSPSALSGSWLVEAPRRPREGSRAAWGRHPLIGRETPMKKLTRNAGPSFLTALLRALAAGAA